MNEYTSQRPQPQHWMAEDAKIAEQLKQQYYAMQFHGSQNVQREIDAQTIDIKHSQGLGNSIPPEAPAGVMDLIEIAHAALSGLEDGFANLRGVLAPLCAPTPEAQCGGNCAAPSEATAVMNLRALIARIRSAQNGMAELMQSLRI